MPETDGLEGMDTFRREFPQTKIVVITGTEKLDAARYLSAAEMMGADAHIP